ncbi:MAG: hypothetical protein GY716_19760 [bacterium]|nr:hypothetical protein [bacterium]
MDRVLAIAGLRLTLVRRRIRGASGVLSTIGAALLYALGGAVSIGIAVAFGAVLHFTVDSGETQPLLIAYAIAFYTFAFVGVILPFLVGEIDQGFDLGPLRIFPVPRGQLFGIHLGSSAFGAEHLLYYPGVLAVFLAGVLAPGMSRLAGTVVLLSFVAFVVIWSAATVLLLVGLMRGRRMRELVLFVVLAVVILASFVPLLVDSELGFIEPTAVRETARSMEPVLRLGRVLPPSLAAVSMVRLHRSDASGAALHLGGLWLWSAAGLALAYWAFVRHHLGDQAGRRGSTVRVVDRVAGRRVLLPTFDVALLRFIPIEVRAVAGKDLLYMLRSLTGKFNLFMVPFFVLVVALVGSRQLSEPVLGVEPSGLVLFGLVLYSTLFSNNFVNNAYAWEGAGIRSYFLGPAPMTRVIAGKNLAIAIYSASLFVVSMVTWSIVIGVPDAVRLIGAALLFGCSLLGAIIVGNVLSLQFPIKRDVSSLSNSPSQIAILISFVGLFVTAGLASAILFVPALLGVPELSPALLLVWLLAEIVVYRWVLGVSADLMRRKKESLIHTLRTER